MSESEAPRTIEVWCAVEALKRGNLVRTSDDKMWTVISHQPTDDMHTDLGFLLLAADLVPSNALTVSHHEWPNARMVKLVIRL